MVVVQAPQHVAAVATEIDVLSLGGEHECIDRQMSLDIAPICLSLECCQLHGLGRHSQVYPGRQVVNWNMRCATKNELTDYLLRPSSPRFCISCDDHVIGPEPEVIPDG